MEGEPYFTSLLLNLKIILADFGVMSNIIPGLLQRTL